MVSDHFSTVNCCPIEMGVLPMSKLIFKTEPTFVPGAIPKLPGERQIRLVTFLCETSTPLGFPVVPMAS